MRTVSYRLGDLARATINIGKVAENEYTRVQFNAEQIFAEYPAATVALSVINPAGTAYPAVVTREGDLIIWDVTDADLTAAGMGELQLTLTENGVVIKSYIARTRIERSIVASGSAPDPVQNWLDEAAEVLEEVQDAIPAGGTQGQVLGKLSDDNYDLGWIDQTGGGGGGGTSNYNELSNKPQIAGTTLTGNKSLEQLGIASAEAVSAKYTKPSSGIPASDLASGVIPDVSGFYTKPQSGIPANDIADGVIPDVSGLYTKPSGGIPKTDLASGVQTSLGKADTAYQKPAGGIPAADIASGVIPDPTDIIDDTAGDGDTDKVWSADKTAGEVSTLSSAITNLEYEVESLDPATPPETISWIDKTWINSSGVAETDNNYEATDYIDLTDVVAISYTGRMGSSRVCFWYDENKTFLSYSMHLNDRMAWFENAMMYKPDDAKYVRLQSKKTTASNPPSITPEVTVYKDANFVDHLRENIVGDGETDDSLALQKIVNMSESVTLPRRDKVLLSSTVHVQMGYARILNGNGCNLVVDDDFYALTVNGTLDGSSDPTGMNPFVVESEAALAIRDFRITSEDITEGGGIDASKAYKLKIEDNYIHHMKNGIRVSGVCRDIIISNNNVFTMTNSGIVFDQGINLHQCNIIGNMLQYAHDSVFINEPYAIANFQIVGNDIEIINYPASTYTTATCIHFKSCATCNMFCEIEISGNTLQGHNTSYYVVLLEGVDDHEIKNVTITGNHIGNSQDAAINMKYMKNVSICGNSYTSVVNYVYKMDDEITNVVISGESAENCGGKLTAASTATLDGVKCKNVRFLTNDTVNIQTSNATDVDVWDEKDVTVSGSTPSITAVPNARYVCGEVSTLSFTPCANGVCEVVFTSGSTATTLTIPNTVKWSDDFDPSDLDASTTYALNVLNGTMGVAAKWV